MSKGIGLSLMAVMLTVVLCMPAAAEEKSAHSISGTVMFGTDYIFRGLSETDNEPSVQGSIDYEHSSGLYAGVWGGNIAGDSEYVDDFDEWTYGRDDGHIEIDFYGGYWVELGPVELDFQMAYMWYPGNADSGLNRDPDILDWTKGEAETDYFEFHVGLAHSFNIPTVPKLSVGYDYSPDYWGSDGSSHHVNAIVELGLPMDFVVMGEAGYMDVEGDRQSGCDGEGTCYGVDDEAGYAYSYYRFGVSREFYGIDVAVNYHFGNSEKTFFEEVYGSEASDRVVVTASYTF